MPSKSRVLPRHPFIVDREKNYECAYCGQGPVARRHRTPHERTYKQCLSDMKPKRKAIA